MTTLFVIRPIGFNIGNDAIAMGVREWISEAFGHAVNIITLPATAKWETHGRSGLTKRTIHEINQYGHGVIVGGGNLYENGELDVDVESLRALEPPLMLFSLSRGRIFNRRDQLVDRTDVMADARLRALDDCAMLSLSRDRATHAYLSSIGCAKSQLGGCPTIFLDRFESRLPGVAEPDRRTCLISVRNPGLMNISLQRQARLRNQIDELIGLARDRDAGDVRLLCHDHRDIPFAASFPDVPYVYTGDVYEYLALLRSCSLNISYRVHSALPCMAFGRSFVKVSYDERGLSLMETVGYGDWNIDMFRETDVVAAVEDRLDRIGELAATRTAAQPAWDELETTQRGAFEAFASAVNDYA
jgi:hypothetical protein